MGEIHPDPFQLDRFVEAQRQCYEQALEEIRAGRKRRHWMWFIFPQIAGLGRSATAQHFAIRSLDEVRSYLAHPVLGPRYDECVRALLDLEGTSAERVFGPVDALKLQSSLTLFNAASPTPLFRTAMERWFNGPDEATLELLAGLG